MWQSNVRLPRGSDGFGIRCRIRVTTWLCVNVRHASRRSWPYRRPKCYVGDEMAVHDVNMHPVRFPLVKHGVHLLSERGKVGRKNARCNNGGWGHDAVLIV